MPPEFGLTPQLSDFAGPAENPLYEDGRWASYFSRPPLQRGGIQNAFGTVEFIVNGSYWTPQSFSGDYVEIWACTPNSGLGAALETYRLLLLLDDPDQMVGYFSSYGGGIGESFVMRKYTGGGQFTQLGEVGGDWPVKLGLRITPTDVEQWTYDGFTWSLVQSFPDTSYRGNFYAALETEEQGGLGAVAFICFGGGAPIRSQFFRWLYN
jgi:hypothetical protein